MIKGLLLHIYVARSSFAVHTVHIMCDIHLLDQSGRDQHHWSAAGFHCSSVSFIKPRHPLAGRPDFISRTQLDSPHSPYLKHDSLRFRVRLGVFTYPFTASPEMRLVDDDFVFFRVAHRYIFCAARCVLGRHCRGLLSCDVHGQLRDVAIPHADPSVFRAAFQYMSTQTIRKKDAESIENSDPNNLESFAAKLLAATNLLQLQALKGMCEASLSKKVSTESIATLLHLAIIRNATQLHAHCLTFAAQNRLVITECDRRKLFYPHGGWNFSWTPMHQDNPYTQLKYEVNILYKSISKKIKKCFN